MVRDADRNAVEDKEKLKQIKMKNNISEYCDEIRKKLNTLELKPRFTTQSKKKIESGINDLKGAIKNEDYSAMKKFRINLETLVKSVESEDNLISDVIDVEVIEN